MHYIRRNKVLVPEYLDGSGHGIAMPQQKMRGEVRCVLRDLMGNELLDTGWQPNLITNNGLVNMGETGQWGFRLIIGSSAAAPVITNTSVGSYLADKQITFEQNNVPVAPNYEIWMIAKARFNAGEGTGTVREIAAHPSAGTINTDISTHALLAAPIVKANDQILDVYYRMYRYPDLVDRTGTIMIEGVSYEYIVRGAYLAESQPPNSFGTANAWGQLGLGSSAGNVACSSDISTLDSGPATAVANPWQDGYTKNSGGSGTGNYTLYWDIDSAIGNIRSFKIREAGNGNACQRGWQIRLGKTSDDTPLPKDNTRELYLTFDVTWGRYP